MPRVLLVFAVLAVLAVIVLLATDPLGLLEDEYERGDAEIADVPFDEPKDAVLEPRPGVLEPEADPRWFEGERVGLLDLGLGSSTLKGGVTGEGTPLFAARVHVVLPGQAGGQGVRTRNDGTWEIRGVPAGSHELRAHHPNHWGRTVVAPAVGADATIEVDVIDLDKRHEPKNGFHVKVSDAFGRPIQGAQIVATTLMWSVHLSLGPEMSGTTGVIERRATTDERGEADLLKLPAESYDVVVIAEGFQTVAQSTVVAAEGRVKNLSFLLQPGMAITGRVLDMEGTPVSGGFVMGLHQPSFVSSLMATTDATGSFVLDGLRTGSYMVIAGHDDHGTAVVNPVKSGQRGVEIRLQGAGELKIQVVRDDGTPVERYTVRPYQVTYFGYTYSPVFDVADPEGRHSVKLPPGAHNLAVKTPGGNFSTDTSATIRVGETVEVRVVVPESAHIAGVVVDPEGQHLSEAEVFVKRGGFPQEPDRELYARTDQDGHFRIEGLPTKKVRLHAKHARYAEVIIEFDGTAAPAEGGGDSELTIRLSAGGAVEGRVVRGENEPVAGETVSAMLGFNFFDAKTTVTDAEGRYRIGALLAGAYTISTGPMEADAGGVTKRDVEVPAEGSVTVDFQLTDPAATGVVVGVVTKGGEPVAGATVRVFDVRGWEDATTVTTDASGAYRAEGVVPGSVRVRASLPSGVSKTERVEVSEEGEIELTVDFGGTTLRGRLLTTEDTPVSGAWIQIERVGETNGVPWSNLVAQTTSRQDGTFEAVGLSAGRYVVRATAGGYASLLSDTIAVSEGATADAGTFRLSAGITIQGRVVDDAGAPVEDATISLRDATGRPLFSFSLVTTGSDGRYEIPGLEPGRYTVGFEAKGYAPSEESVELGAGGATVDGELSRGGSIEVLVQDLGGDALESGRVVLLDAEGRRVAKTLSLVNLAEGEVGRVEEGGKARIPDLAPGLYTVTVRRAGWMAMSDWPMVRVTSGQTATATVVLVPE